MGEIIKILGNFITRDIMYIIGGASVMSSFAYVFGINLTILSDSMFLLIIGFSYVIGFVIKDGLSLTPLVSTSPVVRPNRFWKWLYRIYINQEWKNVKETDIYSLEVTFHAKAKERDFSRLQRHVTLKTLCTTMGSCLLVSSTFLMIRAFKTKTGLDICLTCGVFSLSATLLLLARLKAAQEYQYMSYFQEQDD